MSTDLSVTGISCAAFFSYIIEFARQAFFDAEVERDQFRALWTSYCLIFDLTVDTSTYDNCVLELWNVVSNPDGSNEEDTSDWGDFDSFDRFLARYLV